MKVLISGSSGFVGRHFVRRLLADGHHVIGVDIVRMEPDPLIHPNPNRFFWTRDIRDYVQNERIDTFDLIIHCAAVVGGRLNMENDPLGVASNLSIDYELFSALAKAKTKPRTIYFSSSAIYPPQLQSRQVKCLLAERLLDLNSERFALPETTYGFAKLSGEYLTKQVVEKHGGNIVIYRPFGGYGSDQDLTYPFPAIVQRALRGENPMVVWGSGDQERDFIHIDDIVDIVLATYNKMVPGAVLNLGTGKPTSFKKLATMVCRLAGHDAEIVSDASKPEGVFSRIADTWQMERCGVVPKISLTEGIKRALDYYQERGL